MLENNHSGYQHSNEEVLRPLSRTLICNKCGNHMVGYINKQKNLHYYRCLKCNGVSLSANTKPKIRKKSADQLFLELLQGFQLPNEIKRLVELQLKKLFEHYHQHAGGDEEQLSKQLKAVENQLKDLRISRGLNKIDEETFAVTKEHLETEMQRIQKELDCVVPQISNLQKLLSQAIEKLGNLSKIWASSGYEEKRMLQKSLFPKGVLYDNEKHQYLTSECNRFLQLVTSLSTDCEEEKTATPKN